MTVYVVSPPPIDIMSLTNLVLSEPTECCDGSDEQLGLCPNVCHQAGEAHRKYLEEDRKLRKTVLYNLDLFVIDVLTPP